MKFAERAQALNEFINNTLSPLFIGGGNYFIFDLPFHSNIGDALIWEGEINFLNKLQLPMCGFSGHSTFKLPQLSSDTIILFHGGGNIGELYRAHTHHLIKIAKKYPDNRIIVFPQTVNYTDISILREDCDALNRHKDLHFCVRDDKGYNQLSSYLPKCYLLPDMAFCIPKERFILTKNVQIKGSLFLKRKDGEFAGQTPIIPVDFISDWPTFNHSLFDGTFIAKILDNLNRFSIPGISKIWNWYAWNVYRNDLVNTGIRFTHKYNPIYSTRLHMIILSLLCGKEVFAIDNSYGKISNFIMTWLKDVDEVKLLRNDQLKKV